MMRADTTASDFDILFVADVRFEGGTSTALVEEMRAAHAGGLRSGLIMVKGSLLGRANFPMHPDVRTLVEDGRVEILDPDRRVRVALCVVHHPTIFSLPPRRPLRVDADEVVLVLHHPRLDARGAVQYDLAGVVEICRMTFGRPVSLAPVSRIVRASLPATLPDGATVLAEDWLNIIDAEAWPQRPSRALSYPVVIGRHARPHAQKWPDTREDALAAYPADPAFCRVRILGGGPFLSELYGDLPANWEQLPFGWKGVPEFLTSLDVYVYFHSDAWSEAFGRTVVEAMAVGVPVILPAHLRSSFGDAALYCRPGEVTDLVQQLVANPLHYEKQVQRGLRFARGLSHRSFLDRLQRLFGLATSPRAPALPGRPLGQPHAGKSVLFVSTNGIGLGHLTQQLAIADRLPAGVKSVFATMSYGMKIAADAGYLTHFISYHRHYGADPNRWNRAFAAELRDILAFTRPGVIAYDGSFAFPGLLSAVEAFPDAVSIWVRRPMWRPGHDGGLEGGHLFDHIVEPRELADIFDEGPTKPLQQWAHCVGPILHLEPAQRLSRVEARKALGLPAEGLVAALQIGPGSNYDVTGIRRALLDALLAHPTLTIVELRSPIRVSFEKDADGDARLRGIECFPSFRYSKAFDFMVSAAGYNAFHEAIYGAVPTLFVPNEAPEMDVQLARAHYASIYGLGTLLRRDHDRFAIREVVERMLDPQERAAMKRRCESLPYVNGAVEASRLVADSLCQLRTDVPFSV